MKSDKMLLTGNKDERCETGFNRHAWLRWNY